MSGDLIDTTEMYLRTIYELHEEGIEPLRARIVERLSQSGPTVSQTVSRLARDGLLTVRDDRQLELSEEGWRRAQEVMRKHRLAEVLLRDVIGMDWLDVHEEACRMEHVISGRLEARLAEIMNDPTQSPYGCPIPGADEHHNPSAFRNDVVSLLSVVSNEPKSFKLVRLSEFVQADNESLSALDEVGMRPGEEFEAYDTGDNIELRGSGERMRVERGLCAGIWVAKQ